MQLTDSCMSINRHYYNVYDNIVAICAEPTLPLPDALHFTAKYVYLRMIRNLIRNVALRLYWFCFIAEIRILNTIYLPVPKNVSLTFLEVCQHRNKWVVTKLWGTSQRGSCKATFGLCFCPLHKTNEWKCIVSQLLWLYFNLGKVSYAV